MPPRLPVPGLGSPTVRTPGSQSVAAGSFATRSRLSVASLSAAATRSMMRAPRTSSSPLGRPANRVAWPPARMTPVTDSVATAIRGPQRVVLDHPHFGDRRYARPQALEDEPRQVLRAWHELAL